MCGIAGILNLNASRPIVKDEMERMASVLAHRGPDDSGIYIDPANHKCGLAHRRLSIIDLALGHEPLCNEDESLWITYNGECYNFPQLKHQLIAAGHTFKTNCDAEVVLHLYEQYGQQCVNHIHGMFAFAIWNQNKKELFLARDRMGQKPLYYSFHNGRFIFASECKAILQTENFPRRPDTQSIHQYLLLQYIPAPQTAFADIKQLPPAHHLTIKPNETTKPAPHRYWSIPTEQTFTGTFDDASCALRHELTCATKMRMISDVPLGAFLSGGLDSTAIVALMSQSHSEPIKTCSIGFENQRYNELPYARQAASHFNCDHQEHIVSPDCDQTIEQLSNFYDEPFADSSALPTFLLSKLARQRVTVALTGDGADEALGGYNRYKAMIWSQRISRIGILKHITQAAIWKKIPASEHHSFWHQCKRFMAAASLPPAQRYLKWVAVFDTDRLKSLLSKTEAIEQYQGHFSELFPPNLTAQQCAAQAMLADGNSYLPNDLNTKTDRAAMASSLELRCPFQDHKVLELAYSLPTQWRHNGRTGKLILRDALKDLLPAPIKKRTKMGFAIPTASWFRNELRGVFIDNVLSPRAIQRGWFKKTAIENLLAENDQNRADHGHRLWALLMLELWHRKYIDSD